MLTRQSVSAELRHQDGFAVGCPRPEFGFHFPLGRFQITCVDVPAVVTVHTDQVGQAGDDEASRDVLHTIDGLWPNPARRGASAARTCRCATWWRPSCAA